jgi:hypothetical protein
MMLSASLCSHRRGAPPREYWMRGCRPFKMTIVFQLPEVADFSEPEFICVIA